MSGLFGGSTPATTTQVTQQMRPPYVEQGFQQRYLPGIYAAYERPFQQYQGQRTADLNPNIQGALSLTQARAVNGSPLNSANESLLTNTLNGNYLDVSKNPAWQSISNNIVDQYQHGIAPQTDSAFARANAFGGSAYNEAVQRNQKALGDSLTGAAGDLYNRERGYQMQAAGMAPQASQSAYQDAQQLLGVGDIQRQYEQGLLDQGYQNWYDQANYPANQLNLLGGGLSTAMTGALSNVQTAPNPYRPSPLAGALGGGLAGFGGFGSTVNGQFTGSPWGAGLGALLGLLGSR